MSTGLGPPNVCSNDECNLANDGSGWTLLALGYKTTRASAQYKIRNIQSLEPDTELRILTYTHTSINVSGIVDLLEASNPSRQSWIYVFAVQLVELTGQASAMLIVHDACKANTNHTWANTEAQPESFTSRNAFESYAKGRANVYVKHSRPFQLTTPCTRTYAIWPRRSASTS
ncbi:cation/hydrogen exchanger 15 [Prunus dulcis]|uniref:Cation/hydrogen exchanger 15 n=1 Tax=Prunus dulcis TaxID=3755 RepID=A0A4Y1QXA6_PRUDU|nr:cation/hydrogen exchanger 15 [Prunus dulcis]